MARRHGPRGGCYRCHFNALVAEPVRYAAAHFSQFVGGGLCTGMVGLNRDDQLAGLVAKTHRVHPPRNISWAGGICRIVDWSWIAWAAGLAAVVADPSASGSMVLGSGIVTATVYGNR